MAKKIKLAFKSGYPNYMYTVTPRKMAYNPYIHVHSIGCSFNVKCWMFNIKQRKQSVHESRWSFLVSNFVIMLQKKVIICFFIIFLGGTSLCIKVTFKFDGEKFSTQIYYNKKLEWTYINKVRLWLIFNALEQFNKEEIKKIIISNKFQKKIKIEWLLRTLLKVERVNRKKIAGCLS